MTEIPEHLLARSRARREAAGLASSSEASASPAPAAGTDVEPAAATAATPAPAAAPPPPPPPKPDPPYIQAYKNRKKIPFWAMPALLVLPLWAFIYANTLETPPAATGGPLAAGKTIFGQCASCHGAAGEGGVGPSFQNGELSKSWPKFQDQIRWVSLGSNGWPGDTYGAQNKPKKGGMPAWAGTLTPLQIAEVVRYEREVLGGLPPEPDLVAITEGTSPPLDKDGNPAPAGT
jgi:mono/diheme cytochrome c family protein